MVFACQLDSFQKTYVTRVKSCVEITQNKSGKCLGDCYEVICEDTILFPEGGGQPWDTGFINDVKVEQVLRRGAEAVHFVKKPLAVGQEVTQTLDWERRFDHMQQHSGQHLITAIINIEYKFDTSSWGLGEKVSHVELNVQKLTEDQLMNVEKLVNQKILEQIPVRVKMYEKGDIALESALRVRDLPADIEGPIRIVGIEGVEDNTCCGTHITNTIQLQGIKILYADNSKNNKTKLFFICGGRIMKHLSECLLREQKLMKLLKNEPASHGELVEKLQQSAKMGLKKLKAVLKELAVHEASKFCALEAPPFYFLNNKEGEADFFELFLRNLKEKGVDLEKTLFLFTAGEGKGTGFLILHGDPELVKELGPKVAELLGGKGAAHGPKFQGKVTEWVNLEKAEKLIKDHFSPK